MYKYEHSWNMSGYVNFTLATSPYQDWLSEGKEECRYRAFRDSEGSFTPTHWKILAVKLAFVIVFEVRIFYSRVRNSLDSEVAIYLVNKSLRVWISYDPGWNFTLWGSF